MAMNTVLGWNLSLLICVTTIAGCGGGDSSRPKTYKTTGVVKLNDRPVDGALVTFVLEGSTQSAIGSTDANGEFELSTFGPSDGAVEGQYSVAVSKVDVAAATDTTLQKGVINSGELDAAYEPPAVASPSAVQQQPKSPIPEKYSNSQTSGLRATVSTSGLNHFEFNLK